MRTDGVAEIESNKEEWSEFKSKILQVEQYKLPGISAEKISNISGLFLREVGQ